jgi:oxygen-independent coproporphyrinogen-3 oxidase
VLDDDDVARAALMQAILCEGVVRLRNFEDRHMLDFAIYFENELAQLEQHAERGLVRLSSEEIRVTPLGRLTSRVIAACFDRYRSRDAIPVGDRLKA